MIPKTRSGVLRRRLLALGLGAVIAASLLVLGERVCAVLNRRGAEDPIVYEGGVTLGYFEKDPDLGYRPKPGVRATARARRGEQLLYDAVYTTDVHSRRWSPPLATWEQAPPSRFALFFGCSFTFGEGVEDTETLPHQLALRLPDHRPYNLGFSGYGPQQALEQVRRAGARAAIDEPAGIAVYTFMDEHVDRAIGSMYFAARWGRGMPHYRLRGDGEVERRGSFTSGRPVVSRVYDLVVRSEMAAYFQIALPPRLTDRHFRLTAALLRAAARESRERLGVERYFVLLYPGSKHAARLGALLPPAEIEIVDASGLFDPLAPGMSVGDGHPSPAAYSRLAGRLAEAVTRSAAPR